MTKNKLFYTSGYQKDNIDITAIKKAIHDIQYMDDEHGAFWVSVQMDDYENVIEIPLVSTTLVRTQVPTVESLPNLFLSIYREIIFKLISFQINASVGFKLPLSLLLFRTIFKEDFSESELIVGDFQLLLI